MHYFQFNIGDYIKNTIHLSLMEDLAYRRLLDHYYDSEKPIPTDIPMVSRKMRLDADIIQTVLSEFFELTPEGYRNHRADLEIASYHEYMAKQKANGSKGGRPKKTQPKPTVNPSKTQNNPKQEPLTTNHKPKREIATVVACPLDVEQQIWDDWKQLRKAKKAPVTETVVNSARKEAAKANMAFSDFLSVWCARGSQGLQAEWLKPDERNLSKTGQTNQSVMSGLTRGLVGGGSNVKLLGR